MPPSDTVPVDPANQAQLEAWNGDEGSLWARRADVFERSGVPYHRRLLAAAAIERDDRIVDVGCGTGQSTRWAAAAAPGGSALGVDLSLPMIEHARRRAADDGVTNVSFEQLDAQVHGFTPRSFDVAISHTGATFFGDPVAGFANVRGALRPGGRLAFSTWQGPAANEWFLAISGALAAGRDLPAPPPGTQGPFAFADRDHLRAVLTNAGFSHIDVDGAGVPFWIGNDVDDAARVLLELLGWLLAGLDDAGRAHARDALRATLAAHQGDDGITFGSAVWTARATA
jgi:SAM-dependent methyltransferase